MQGVKYNVDIAICIDATGSMHPVIDDVKKGALKFHEDLSLQMSEKGKSIDTLRIKVIGFRDFYDDPSTAIIESQFYNLPEQKEKFSDFVDSINAEGGGDEPENGLEAIDIAIKSDWNKTGDKRRHVIVVWTDASTHELEKNISSKPKDYPKNMAKNFDELTDNWDGGKFLNDKEKRIIMFAPDAYPWTDISTHWGNSIHFTSKAGKGLDDIDYSEILAVIANSI
jgi:hypothetical protein